MPRLSLGLGVGGSGLIAPAAPSGIPVANAANVVIAGQNATVPDGTYTKVTANGTRVAGSLQSDKLLLDTGIVYLKEAGADVIEGVTLAYGQILVPPDTIFESTYGAAVSPEPFWRAGVVRANYSEDEPYFYFAFLTISTNSSTDPTSIPTAGWSPNITITAAPSGITAANAASLIIGNIGEGSGTYNRVSGNNSTGSCYGGASVYDANSIASNYYYVGPSASTFGINEDGEEVFVQCYKYFLFGPNTRGEDYPPTYGQKVLPQGVWKIYKNIQDSSAYTTYELIASNTSSNINIIPTLNWSPAITITAAPSGIEVATTASVTVAGFTGGDTTYNGTYTKGTSGGSDPTITTPPTDGEVYIKGLDSFVLLPPSVAIGGNNSYDGDEYPYSFEAQGNWTISRIDSYEDTTSLTVIATNPSANNDYIPTTGWSPAITITAAPSNIPLSQTNISLTGFSYTPVAYPEVSFSLIARSAVLTKDSDTFWYSDYSNPNNPTGYDILLTFSSGAWRINVRFFDPDFTELAATNPAPNTSIPVTGWVLEAGVGNSGSVTITAA